jgi:hypothetical protein
MLSFNKKKERIVQIVKNEKINRIVEVKLFTTIKKRNAKRGGNPVVAKVYLLKFSKTCNSLKLFSNNKAKQILPNGLRPKLIKNNKPKNFGKFSSREFDT